MIGRRARPFVAAILGLPGAIVLITFVWTMPYPTVPSLGLEEQTAAAGAWWLGASWVCLALGMLGITVGLPTLYLGRAWGAAVLVAALLLWFASEALVGDPPMYMLFLTIPVAIGGWMVRSKRAAERPPQS